jgi:predicted dehydrogenase
MLSVLGAAPADIRVVRAVEPNLETARTLCDEKGVALTANYADALADPEVEAVVLATPHALHGEQIEAAVGARKHVFCEKPLALNKAGAEKAVRLCRDAGLVLGMGHERRWEPPIAQMLAVAAYVKFRGGGTSYVSASLANPCISRFAVFGSKGWIDIRDKAHVEAPDGWVVTSAKAGGLITTVEVPPAEPVKDNLVSFARAVRGTEPYPITADHLVNNIALLEAVFASARSGKIETVA